MCDNFCPLCSLSCVAYEAFGIDACRGNGIFEQCIYYDCSECFHWQILLEECIPF